ncbi:lytic transglycosylase domain-containing protein [Thiomonas sp.]|uniref:lytic transglycosylase domain-containing protein n=1 Tax=Thiomonas sp. TaxID=2047785 RepID=UPI0026257FF0|nr:lytic transglycosylase domain-containing protein [Thiomonas sp.]
MSTKRSWHIVRRVVRLVSAVTLAAAAHAAQAQSAAATGSAPQAVAAVMQQIPPQIPPAQAQRIVQAQQAAQRGDPQPALDALAQFKGSLLEPWLAYWAIKPTLSRATQQDFDAFAAAYPHTYVLDRLRNDWLLELGKRQDWADFDRVYAGFLMRDDPQVQCYDLQSQYVTQHADVTAQVFALWMEQRYGGAGCNSAATALLQDGAMPRDMLWLRLRRFYADGRARQGRDLLAPFLPPGSWRILEQTDAEPVRFLLDTVRRGAAAAIADGQRRQYVVLALLSMARQDPAQAARLLQDDFSALPARDRAQLWGRIGLAAALNLQPDAVRWFSRMQQADATYSPAPVVREWQVRAALRAQDWEMVRSATRSLIDQGSGDAAWSYWHARALEKLGHPIEARALFAEIANPWDFYGQLATDALGMKISLPPSLPPAPAAAVAQQAARPGMQRALALFSIDLRNEAVREWNFSLRGLDNAQMQAAAELACQQQLWDRCINTSERVKGGVDIAQRYAMPYREAIARAARTEGVSEAFLYGLIRQESRFIANIKSWVGASGLMQLMPATARLVARKIGLTDYTHDQITDVGVNVQLGSAYLGGLLQQFGGSEALAAAGYNAGPGRPLRWRSMGLPQQPLLPGAVFAENIPIAETRDYVKRVLANATVYAAILSGKPQSLKARLGDIGVPDAMLASNQH